MAKTPHHSLSLAWILCDFHIHTLSLTHRKHCRRRGRKISVRLCLHGMSETTPVKSYQHDSLDKDNNIRHIKVDRAKPMRPQLQAEYYRQLRNTEGGQIVFSREKPTSWPSNTKGQFQTYIQAIDTNYVYLGNI